MQRTNQSQRQHLQLGSSPGKRQFNITKSDIINKTTTMYRLYHAHSFLKNRITDAYPHLYGNYSHRFEKDRKVHYHLSLRHDGEELVNSMQALAKMTLPGEHREQAEALLNENPNARFAMVRLGSNGLAPYLYL